MEVVGAAASIAQLVSLAGSILSKGYTYLSKVKKAPQEIRALLRETASLQALLHELQALSEDSEFDGALETLQKLGVFEDCEVLMGVVRHSIKACEQIQGETAKNLGKKAIWPFKEKETKETVMQLGRLRESLSAAVVVDSAVALRELETTASRIDRNVIETLATVVRLKFSIDDTAIEVAHLNAKINEKDELERNAAVRRWLYPDGTDSEAGLANLLEVRHTNTGTWLLESEIYKSWSDSANDLIWIHGIAGCGKTIISATVINHLQQNRIPGTSTTIYFFCDRRDPRKQTFQDLLHVIVKQLTEEDPNCFAQARKRNEEMKMQPQEGDSPAKPLTIPNYTDFIRELFTNWSSVSLVVDALDECADATNFINGLQTLTAEASNVKVFVTSRYDAELVKSLGSMATRQLSLVEHMQHDIETYLKSEVERRVASKMIKFREPGLDLKIFDALNQRSSGMILIAKLQLEYISGLKNDRAIKDALKTLPSGIYSTYDEILHQLCTKRPDEVDEIKFVLQWLTCSIVPLTLDELAEAISIWPSDERLDKSGVATDIMDVAASCGSLITLRKQDTTGGLYEDLRGDEITLVSLSHASVEEYLKSQNIGKGLSGESGKILFDRFHIDPIVVHGILGRTCIQYVGFHDFETPIVTADEIEVERRRRRTLGRTPDIKGERRLLKIRTSEYALYDYACRYWPDHFRLSNFSFSQIEETAKLCDWFIKDGGNDQRYLSWQQMYHRDVYCCCLGRPPLYYAIEFKIKDLVSCLLPAKERIDLLFDGVSALHVASRCGAIDTVIELLNHGASMHLKSGPDAKQMTSIHYAAEGGHARIVELLIVRGASPDEPTESGATPFYRAARSGSIKTLKVLYDVGCNINAETWDSFTPLFEAVAHYRPNVAAQLLKWGADPAVETSRGESVLRYIREFKNKIAARAKGPVSKEMRHDIIGIVSMSHTSTGLSKRTVDVDDANLGLNNDEELEEYLATLYSSDSDSANFEEVSASPKFSGVVDSSSVWMTKKGRGSHEPNSSLQETFEQLQNTSTTSPALLSGSSATETQPGKLQNQPASTPDLPLINEDVSCEWISSVDHEVEHGQRLRPPEFPQGTQIGEAALKTKPALKSTMEQHRSNIFLLSDEDILYQIRHMQARNATIAEFREYLSGMSERYVYLRNLWDDTRPGTEREKENRWTQDPNLIGTMAEYYDRYESDGEHETAAKKTEREAMDRLSQSRRKSHHDSSISIHQIKSNHISRQSHSSQSSHISRHSHKWLESDATLRSHQRTSSYQSHPSLRARTRRDFIPSDKVNMGATPEDEKIGVAGHEEAGEISGAKHRRSLMGTPWSASTFSSPTYSSHGGIPPPSE